MIRKICRRRKEKVLVTNQGNMKKVLAYTKLVLLEDINIHITLYKNKNALG